MAISFVRVCFRLFLAIRKYVLRNNIFCLQNVGQAVTKNIHEQQSGFSCFELKTRSLCFFAKYSLFTAMPKNGEGIENKNIFCIVCF